MTSLGRKPAASAGVPRPTTFTSAPGREGNVQLGGALGREVLAAHAQVAARDPPRAADLVGDLARQVDGDGEPDVHGDARVDDRRVDADDLAPEVEQRPARVALVDGGVGLDEVLVAGIEVAQLVADGAVLGADDAHRDGLPEAERVADGEDVVARPAPARSRRASRRAGWRAACRSSRPRRRWPDRCPGPGPPAAGRRTAAPTPRPRRPRRGCWSGRRPARRG